MNVHSAHTVNTIDWCCATPRTQSLAYQRFQAHFFSFRFYSSLLLLSSFVRLKICTMEMLSVQSRIAFTAHHIAHIQLNMSTKWMKSFCFYSGPMDEYEWNSQHLLNFMWMHNNVSAPVPNAAIFLTVISPYFFLLEKFIVRNSEWYKYLITNVANNNGECG